ncbi:carbon storage regulator CsrA [Bacillus timonensis]|uniref:carbon storage regulator CsrA n=1 Tax=Bacillus timonensis TaxID=1033734 RepID=UPI000289B71E|nr:carbon storage regulator CsrA [Bacillus timonensis]
MLVLTRKLKESIMIGSDIELVVVEIDGDQVKLGIKAPKNVEIHRKEIFDKISKENTDASNVNFNLVKKIGLINGKTD